MRPLVAIVMASIVLGGVHIFLWLSGDYAVHATAPADVVPREAAGVFAVEITLTFDAEADAFFADRPTSLAVRLAGKAVLSRAEPIPSGTVVVAERVAGIVEGPNDFYVEAIPRPEAVPVARAVRVRITRDGRPIAEQTMWSEPGDPVAGSVTVVVPATVGGHPD